MNGGEIETLFVERIGQLLKPQGIAAVILPSSILSNDSASYTGAREQFLQNFYIRAIVAFGSNTFGATGTNTVVMFLEKYNEPPKKIDLSTDSVDAIFRGAELAKWKDKEILEAYLTQIGLEWDDYKAFLSKSYSLDELKDMEYFNMYVGAFEASTDAKNLQKKKEYKSKSADEQTAVYLEKFYSYAHSIEQEKLLYFSLVYGQITVIITAPTDNKAQKDFLGYDWSNRKGNEGIQIIKPGGKMYDDADRAAEGTLANAIKQSFNSVVPNFTDEQQVYGSVVSTKDMLDFSRVSFNKAIRLTKEKTISINTKYPIIPLVTIANIQKGTAITANKTENGRYKVVAGGIDFAYYHNQFNREANIVTISASGANAGFVNYWSEKIFASDCTTVRGKNVYATKWIYYYLKSIQNKIFYALQKGASQPHVYTEDIKTIPIPDIEEKLMKKIVKECEKIDDEYNSTRMTIETYRQKIETLFAELDVANKAGGGGTN